MDQTFREEDRKIKLGIATDVEVEQWDARRVRLGLWTPQLLDRVWRRTCRTVGFNDRVCNLAVDGLRGLVNEARGKSHWVRMIELPRGRKPARRRWGDVSDNYVILVVEPDQAVVMPCVRYYEERRAVWPLAGLPARDSLRAISAYRFQGSGIDYYVGGWDLAMCQWIDDPREGKLVLPRAVAEEWASVHRQEGT